MNNIIWRLLISVTIWITKTSFSLQSLIFKPIPIEISSSSMELFLRTSSSSSVYISTGGKNIIFAHKNGLIGNYYGNIDSSKGSRYPLLMFDNLGNPSHIVTKESNKVMIQVLV